MEREFDPAIPEKMDREQGRNVELETALRNLITLNRVFGSHGIIRRFFRRVVAGCREEFTAENPLRMLDLATGAGDVPRVAVDEARRLGVPIEVCALDLHPTTLEYAREWSAGYPEIRFEQADLLALEGRSNELVGQRFTLVNCALALHHFSEADARRILEVARQFSERWVICSDLERSRLNVAMITLLTAVVMRDDMTRHDARVSSRRAFTFAELQAMAREAGWSNFTHRRVPMARQVLTMSLSESHPNADAGGGTGHT